MCLYSENECNNYKQENTKIRFGCSGEVNNPEMKLKYIESRIKKESNRIEQVQFKEGDTFSSIDKIYKETNQSGS